MGGRKKEKKRAGRVVIGKATTTTRPDDVSSGLAGSSRNHRSRNGTWAQPVGSAELMVWATTGAAQLPTGVTGHVRVPVSPPPN
jgi:hypothetical protein